MRGSLIYSDVDSVLNETPDGDIDIKPNEEAVFQSVKNILSTVKGERVRNGLGSVLLRFLFEPISEDTADEIRTEIFTSIRRYEPRVKQLRVNVRPDPDAHTYHVSLEMSIDRFSAPVRYQMSLRSLEGRA